MVRRAGGLDGAGSRPARSSQARLDAEKCGFLHFYDTVLFLCIFSLAKLTFSLLIWFYFGIRFSLIKLKENEYFTEW
jgi:hypothetical protein